MRIAVIDPAYASGNPKVTFEGESTLSVKQYPYLDSYTPQATNRVVMAPVGTTYVILGALEDGTDNISKRLDALAKGLIKRIRSSVGATSGNATATPIQDTDMGNLVFTAVSGRNYRITFDSGWRSDTATATMDVTIRDGGGSSPTGSSTTVAGSSAFIGATAGTGRTNFQLCRTLSCPADIAAGTHTLGVFFARTVTGSGTVFLQESASMHRELCVFDEGTQSV
jgi:hypothetical protein